MRYTETFQNIPCVYLKKVTHKDKASKHDNQEQEKEEDKK